MTLNSLLSPLGSQLIPYLRVIPASIKIYRNLACAGHDLAIGLGTLATYVYHRGIGEIHHSNHFLIRGVHFVIDFTKPE